jgi:hypothetical protein
MTIEESSTNPQACRIRVAKIPVRTLPPVLAGIRADKRDGRPSHANCTVVSKDRLFIGKRAMKTRRMMLAYRCGGSTRWLAKKRRVSRLTARMSMRAGTRTPIL